MWMEIPHKDSKTKLAVDVLVELWKNSFTFIIL